MVQHRGKGFGNLTALSTQTRTRGAWHPTALPERCLPHGSSVAVDAVLVLVARSRSLLPGALWLLAEPLPPQTGAPQTREGLLSDRRSLLACPGSRKPSALEHGEAAGVASLPHTASAFSARRQPGGPGQTEPPVGSLHTGPDLQRPRAVLGEAATT